MMTPLKRVLCTNKNSKPDKLPIFVAAMNEFICHYYNISVQDYLTDADACAEASIKFIEEFEIDSSIVAPGYILYGCGPEIGVEWEFVEGHFPGNRKGIIHTEGDIKKLAVPKQPTGYFGHYVEVIEKVTAALGKDYSLLANILGPFATACFLRGIENVLMDTMTNQKLYREYMDVCTDLSVYFGQNILSTGINRTLLNEIFLTPGMVRPDSYHELIAPYTQQVQDSLAPLQSVPNTMGAFMGNPGDSEGQKNGAALSHAFFGTANSLDEIKRAADYILPGFSFPVTVSGEAFDAWSIEKILVYLKEALDFFILEKNIYPTISVIAICAGSTEQARCLADKLRAVIEFRNNYNL